MLKFNYEDTKKDVIDSIVFVSIVVLIKEISAGLISTSLWYVYC